MIAFRARVLITDPLFRSGATRLHDVQATRAQISGSMIRLFRSVLGTANAEDVIPLLQTVNIGKTRVENLNNEFL